MIAPQKALEELDSLELEPEARERFLGANAQEVFALGAGRRADAAAGA